MHHLLHRLLRHLHLAGLGQILSQLPHHLHIVINHALEQRLLPLALRRKQRVGVDLDQVGLPSLRDHEIIPE